MDMTTRRGAIQKGLLGLAGVLGSESALRNAMKLNVLKGADVNAEAAELANVRAYEFLKAANVYVPRMGLPANQRVAKWGRELLVLYTGCEVVGRARSEEDPENHFDGRIASRTLPFRTTIGKRTDISDVIPAALLDQYANRNAPEFTMTREMCGPLATDMTQPVNTVDDVDYLKVFMRADPTVAIDNLVKADPSYALIKATAQNADAFSIGNAPIQGLLPTHDYCSEASFIVRGGIFGNIGPYAKLKAYPVGVSKNGKGIWGLGYYDAVHNPGRSNDGDIGYSQLAGLLVFEGNDGAHLVRLDDHSRIGHPVELYTGVRNANGTTNNAKKHKILNVTSDSAPVLESAEWAKHDFIWDLADIVETYKPKVCEPTSPRKLYTGEYN